MVSSSYRRVDGRQSADAQLDEDSVNEVRHTDTGQLDWQVSISLEGRNCRAIFSVVVNLGEFFDESLSGHVRPRLDRLTGRASTNYVDRIATDLYQYRRALLL